MGKRIHFMGIGGSAMSAVAQIAKNQGYIVTGCDFAANTPYLAQVKKVGIPVSLGHSADHLKNTDLLCVTPAVFYLSPDSPEFLTAKKGGFVTTWEDFMGNHLHTNKFLICIAGTHGKSTTTAIAGLLLEKAGLDPTVEIGATVKEWDNNVRIGKSDNFISEADEFYDNFKTYKPEILILTMVEYDHPEYFGTYEKMLESFKGLIQRIKPGGTLIYNADSPGCISLITQSLNHSINLIPYSLSDFPKNLKLSQPGNHNKLNALAIIKLGKVLNIPHHLITQSLSHFKGLNRRLDLIGEKQSIKVYDDYANHPSSYKATISAVKELHPESKLTVIIEPHTFSRLRALLPELPASVAGADEVIVSKIYPSREKDPGDFTGQDIVNTLHHPHAKYIPEFNDIVSYLITHNSKPQTILVMGSGNSYLLSRQILESL